MSRATRGRATVTRPRDHAGGVVSLPTQPRAGGAFSHHRTAGIAAALGGAAAAWPLGVHAQQPALPVVGSLFSVSAAQWEDKMAGFRPRLGRSGLRRRPQRHDRLSLGRWPT